MLLCLWVSVLLGHAEVHYMDDVGSFCVRSANQEVVWFYVAVDKILLVDCLHS